MSSLNSDNDFEGLDDPFGASGIVSEDFQEDMSIGTQGEEGNFATAPEDGGVELSEQPADSENPESLEFTEETAPETQEAAAVAEYKRARCWDMYSWLLFIAWLALLGGILFLWLECPPSEYGDPPYKENSVPVKSATP